MGNDNEMMQAALQAAEAEAAITGGQSAGPGAQPAADAGPIDAAGKLAELKAENLGLIELALAMLEPVLPFIRGCYTPEACEKIAQAGAEVEAKYGVSVGDLFSKWKPEIMLAIAIVPPTIAAVTMTRALMAKRRADQPLKSAPEPAAGAGGGVVVPLKPNGGGDGAKTPGTT